MRFSILVPVYNVGKFLSSCLDSVLSQSFHNFEIICVNDGSTDNSLSILESYSKKDNRIKIISKNNEGLLWARRDAIKKASGEYILFLDSDDKYNGDVLNLINDCLIRNNNPDLLIFDRAELINDKVVYTCPHYFKEERAFSGESLSEIRYNFIVRNYLNGIFLKCIKASLIKEDNTDYSNCNPQMAEDVTQSIFMFDKSKTIVFLPCYIYLFRKNPYSMTRSPLLFDNLEHKIVRKLFSRLYLYINTWNLPTYNNDVYEKFFNKAYTFYCDRVIELYNNKNNKNIVKKVIGFPWFNEDNGFLNNKDFVKSAKLKTSNKLIILSLINKNSAVLVLGLLAYNVEKVVTKAYHLFCSIFEGKKHEL